MRSTDRAARIDLWSAALAGDPPVLSALYGGDWATRDVRPLLAGVDDAMRVRLTQQWTQLGLSAHASVGALARFALQLLSLGAPPELVSRAQSAMADKTRHARVAFALASHYDGRTVGPGKLPLERDVQADDAERILMELMAACFVETVASSEAKEALDHVTDPALRFALSEIARDTAEHALLAWRSLIWLCDVFGEPAAMVVEDAISAIRAALAQRPRSCVVASEEELLVLGYIGPSVREGVRRMALERVVLRGLEALLTGASAPSSVDGGRLTLA